MNFQRPDKLELQFSARRRLVGRENLVSLRPNSNRPRNNSKRIVAAAVLIGLVYLATQISVTGLLIIGGIGLAILCLAAAVCIYALNATPVGF